MEIEDNSILKVKLIDFKDTELNRTVHRAFQSRCRENNIPIEVTHYSNDLIIYKIPYSEKAMPVLQSFEGLNSIEDMPTYSITFGLEPEIKTKFEGIKEPSKDENYPTVGVLDSGIAANDSLTPWIMGDKHTNFIDEDIDTAHGTAVASVLIYGDQLENKTHTGLDGCYLFDATIVPKKELLNTITEFDLRENIAEAITSNSDIKVWNLLT